MCYISKHASQPLSERTCILTLRTWKLQVVYWRSTHRMTAILLKMSIFCVRAGCEIWFVSYGSKHASQFLSDKPFACRYMQGCWLCAHSHILKATGYIWMVRIHVSEYRMIALLSETLLVWFTVAREFNWRVTVPNMHWSFPDIKCVVCILEARLYIAIWCATMHDNKTHIPHDDIHNTVPHTKWWLYCQRCIVS